MDGSLAEALFSSYLGEKPNVLYGFDVSGNMQTIIDAAKDKTIPYEQMVHKAALAIHRILIGAKDFMETQAEDLQTAVKEYIDDHLEKPLRLEEISERFHYSKNHIINTFRAMYGVTPYVYYERQKMQMAKELLLNTSVSVSEISKKLGYDNPQYFSKCFKKHYDIQPTVIRRGEHVKRRQKAE